MNYSFLYKQKFDEFDDEFVSNNFKYDLFISAYNLSDRVNYLFNNVSAEEKHWLIFPEYRFGEIDVADLKGTIFDYSNKIGSKEDVIIQDYYEKNEILLQEAKIAVDITGMLRPYIIYLVRYLKAMGINEVDFIYSEPQNYKKKEDTLFSLEHLEIRDVMSCSGTHYGETTNDFLIIGAGYDQNRISRIAEAKPEAKKVQVLGFPSLQADMFQQNVLKSYKAEEETSAGEFDLDSNDIILAPANDPFITAQLISDFIKLEEQKKSITNLYLCPLSTKAQTLGMALYYACECDGKTASIIFPFSGRYSTETSEGISKICIYTVEFPN
jgi:hypothetical protein